ncbi:transporter substrate-binding domain-containing protein [Salmonella enterica]|nr:transporter substrate-binding domain-containing protein [Salmonella enterica]EBR6778838.1 transporter substrate-binding domain-containing protein [Salmonella enterica]ECZ6337507.1 transporter substrate-binding domain-containing protein [Salmonella enterica]EIV1992547.1 transporter substrate-binding domain-containing protein [Salmonella enterica subsp. enterica serovar Give]ELW6661261.1 transporter substrate-binding domain-containing protein [Salmonella enterica]
MIKTFIIFLSVFLVSNITNASERAPTINVGVYISQPFVMSENNKLTGLAVDLWLGYASKNGLKTIFTEYPTIDALLNATRNGNIDVAVSNITLTEERARYLTFSFPWYDSGLRIMVKTGQKAPLKEFFSELTDDGHIRVYLLIVVVIIMGTFVLTILDRKLDVSFPRSWFAGLAESFYHVMSIVTTGKTSHKLLFGSVGKIIAGIWMVCGVTVIAYITSSITSTMTTSKLQSVVHNINDLSDKKTGVRIGSEAEKYLKSKGMDTKPFTNLTEAVSALNNNEITAIIADSPSLEYYVRTKPYSGVKIVGPIFHPEKFGFALPLNSEHTHKLTTYLIGLHESGELYNLQKKYF